MFLLLLFPLNCSRRFARDVVDDAVDVRYFVHDAGADGLQHFPRDASEVTRHAVYFISFYKYQSYSRWHLSTLPSHYSLYQSLQNQLLTVKSKQGLLVRYDPQLLLYHK